MGSIKVVFKPEAIKDLDTLDKRTVTRIIQKIEFFSHHPDPLRLAKKMKHHAIGEYRFRIGDYRVIFDFEKNTILILRIGHRASVYK